MNAGVRNKVPGKIKEIKSDGVMALIKMNGTWLNDDMEFSSVMTNESLEEVGFKEGDNVEALIKAINVVFVKH